MTQTLTIEHKTYIHVHPSKVYETLTTGKGWDAWFTQGTAVDARKGGRIHFRFKDFGPEHITMEDGGAVLESDLNERSVFQWTPGDSTTTVSFTLTEVEEGTMVNVTEIGYTTSERDLAAYSDCSVGWGEALTLLKFYLEHGITYGQVPRHTMDKIMVGQYEQRTDDYLKKN
ncbi:SRPBCC family protein [Bacillus horti]|uniref:Uncharacterized protein YndB with AHSA1/START domain n=1 Tax=Caldalkalibacillus horti TaxID=77523 RepID=A0ABT9VZ38_9BACI|nr:SRPBCC domain-containing protein [Bacillus horti]MDQ0165870.1 uncharacterized protein YndB with AHSA1/START domain [Bacillus horti]